MLSLSSRIRPAMRANASVIRCIAAADKTTGSSSLSILRPTLHMRMAHTAAIEEGDISKETETKYITAPLQEFQDASLELKRIIHNRRIKGREVKGALKLVAKLLGVNSKTSTCIRMARIQYELCTIPGTGTFIQDFKLSDTLMSWFSVTHLHVWMCMCRNAHLDDPHYVKNLNKDLYECFQEDISARIYAMGVTDAMEVGRRIKQLVEIFWGFTVAYDEGLLYEDSVLAAALWRNMYDCRPDVPIQELEALVRYIRRETLALDDMSDSDVLLGITYFKPPDYQPHESHSPVADNVQ